jgi:hypothetical protein
MARRSVPTPPEGTGLAAARRSARLRVVGTSIVALFIVAAAAGLMGVRARTIAATGSDGTRVSVTYASISRRGLATPWDVVVERPGGFDDETVVRTSSDYLAAFDENGLDPEPAESTSDATDPIWTFDPPEGETLTVSFDARLERGVQWRRQGTTTVDVGAETVTLSCSTWVWP